MPGRCDRARLRTRLLRELPGTAGGTTASPSPRRAGCPKNKGIAGAGRVAGAALPAAGTRGVRSPCGGFRRAGRHPAPRRGGQRAETGSVGGLNIVGLGFLGCYSRTACGFPGRILTAQHVSRCSPCRRGPGVQGARWHLTRSHVGGLGREKV